MVTCGPVDVVLEFVACGAMLSTSAFLVMYWHPQLERVREWCKAGFAHPDRDRLLHLVGLTPIAWGARVRCLHPQCLSHWPYVGRDAKEASGP